MRVFSVKHDPNYQYFFPIDGHFRVFAELDGNFREDDWSPPRVHVPEPQLVHGNFYNFSNGFLIIDPPATEILHGLLTVAGELLPLPYHADVYRVLNVTECADCLDHDQTVWSPVSKTEPLQIIRYVFRPGLVPMSPIFKIPEEATTSIFVSEGMTEEQFEFREILRREQLKGLTFTEVWSDGD